MDLKKRIILRQLIVAGLGLFLFIISIFRPALRTGAITCLIGYIINTVLLIRNLKDEKHFEKYKKSLPDEREDLINWKSGNTAFWVTLFATFIAMCIFGCLNMEKYMDICLYIGGFQLLVLFISYFIYRKKY